MGIVRTVGRIVDEFEEAFPEAKGLLTTQMASYLMNAAIQAERANTPTPPEIVRVMRVYVFEGERKVVEEQLSRSLGDGTRLLTSGKPPIKIHVATIGSIPQILPSHAGYPGWAGKGYKDPLGDLPVAEPLGAHMVYVCRPNWPGNIRAEYARALACGATAILIPNSTDSQTGSLYTLAGFRSVWDYALAPVEALPAEALPAEAPDASPPAVSEEPPPPAPGQITAAEEDLL